MVLQPCASPPAAVAAAAAPAAARPSTPLGRAWMQGMNPVLKSGLISGSLSLAGDMLAQFLTSRQEQVRGRGCSGTRQLGARRRLPPVYHIIFIAQHCSSTTV